ncbi:MAG: hypothetical protein ABMA64_23635 [Myxococcota bacterium]
MLPFLVANSALAGVNGLLDYPEYEKYLAAVQALGTPIAIPSVAIKFPNVPQLAPGAVGMIVDGSTPRGWLMVVPNPVDRTQYIEAWVMMDQSYEESLSVGGFTLEYESLLFPPTTVGLDAKLGTLEAVPGNDYTAARFTVSNRKFPSAPSLADLNLLSITPLTHPAEITLLGFRLEQNNVDAGYLLRERRDHGVQGVVWFDHWYYLDNHVAVGKPGDATEVVPDGVVWTSIPEFVGAMQAEVLGNPPRWIKGYQQAAYSYDDLTLVAP